VDRKEYLQSAKGKASVKKYLQSDKGKAKGKAARRKYYKSDKWKAVMRKYRYNLSQEQYSKLLKDQKGLCAICHKAKKLYVDHNHKTDKFRGLLCHKCNLLLIGLESPLFKKLKDYLKERRS